MQFRFEDLTPLVKRAFVYQKAAHGAVGQVRKYTGEPYWYHPARVAELVATAGLGQNAIAAALLHDVVEDTEITIEQIKEEFGNVVADYVYRLTDVSKPHDGNRATRKRIDREHVAKGCADVHSVKVADLIDNSISIIKHDPEFAKVYLQEKRLLLDVLVKANDGLLGIARELLQRGEDKINAA